MSVPRECVDLDKQIPGWSLPRAYEHESAIQYWGFDWDACDMQLTGEDDYENYVVNLMWIFKNESDTATVFPDDTREQFADQVLDWVEAGGPGGSVYFWFDGEMVDPVAVQKTRQLLSERIKERGFFGGNLQFRDLRSLPDIQDNPFVFSSYIPIYYRSDLARLIVTSHLLNEENVDLVVYADIDMPVISRENMLDETTVNTLKKMGYVFEVSPEDIPPGLLYIEPPSVSSSQLGKRLEESDELDAVPFTGPVVVGQAYENAFFILSSDVNSIGMSLSQTIDSYFKDFYQTLGIDTNYYGEIEIKDRHAFTQHIWESLSQRLLRNIISNEGWSEDYFQSLLSPHATWNVWVPVKPVHNPHQYGRG